MSISESHLIRENLHQNCFEKSDDGDSIRARAHQDLLEQARNVENLAHRLDAEFVTAVNLIFQSDGRVVVMGIGKSGLVGRKISATLASTGTPSIFVHPAEALHGDLGILKSKDIVILISYSGETAEILQLIPSLRKFGNTIVAITGCKNSSLAKNADVILDAFVDKEICPHNLAPTTSTLAAMALGDVLAVSLMRLRGFTPRDFARFHPGGSLGRRLATRVRDAMVSNNLPIVPPDAFMDEVIWIMTKGRLGLAIVQQDDALLGLVTDGDLRRTLVKGFPLAETTVDQVMTRQPMVIGEYENVGVVEDLMRARRISSILVVNAENKLTGVFQIHRDLNS